MIAPILIVWVLSITTALSAPPADLRPNPYRHIVSRNIFKLEPKRKEGNQTKSPAPKVKLLGVTTILRGKRAILRVQFPATQGERIREKTYLMKEREIEDMIEVLEIDEIAGAVRLAVNGTIMIIGF